MTTKQAMKEAKRRWGKNAYIDRRKRPHTRTRKDGTEVVISERFCVGRIDLGMFFAVQGDGKTWEEAFAKVDEKKAKEQARIKERVLEGMA